MAIPSFLNRDNIAAALQGLATGLVGYGSGNPNAGLLAVSAIGAEKDRRQQNARMQAIIDRQAAQDAYEAQKRADEAKRRQAASDALRGIVGGQPGLPPAAGSGIQIPPSSGLPMPQPPSGSQTGQALPQPPAGSQTGIPLGQPGMKFDAIQAAVLQGMDPEQALALIGQQAFEKPEAAKWDIKTIREGNQDVTYRINPMTGEREKLGAGAAWAPQQVQQFDQFTPYTDPMNGRTGQKSLRTGKIDWDPVQSEPSDIQMMRQGGIDPKSPEGQAMIRAKMSGGQGSEFKQANTLRDEYNQLTKDFRTVQDAYNKIKATSPTGAGDMSLLYSYVKLLDPGSVVRESEFATAAASGSFGQQVQGAVQRILTGERLPDDLRASFKSEADRIYAGQKIAYDNTTKGYSELAKRAGVAPEDVTPNYATPQPPIDDMGPTGQGAPVPDDLLQKYPFLRKQRPGAY